MKQKSQYIVIFESLLDLVGTLPANSLLPTEQQLAKRYLVSRVTIRRALGLLERSGRIARERGRGTIVSPPKITRRIVHRRSIDQDLSEQGIKLETRVLRYTAKVPPPSYVCDSLGLSQKQTTGLLELQRLVDDRIICYDIRYLAPAIARRFRPNTIQHHAFHDIVENLAGVPITYSDWETEIIPASYEIASALNIRPGVLVWVNKFSEFLKTGEPADAGEVFYRIDRVKFRMRQPITAGEHHNRSMPRGSL